MARIDQVLAGEKSWGEYSLDVLAHAGLGAAYALPFVAVGLDLFGWTIGIALGVGEVAAVVGGVIREIVQGIKSGKLHLLDRVLDVLHHTLGPPLAIGLWLLLPLFF